MNAEHKDFKHKELTEEHEAQLLNYLKTIDVEVGPLLNFGSKPEIKRKAFNNLRKNLAMFICKN